MKSPSSQDSAWLGELDLHLFREGSHTWLHQRFGGRLHDGGARFVVWAPNARAVSVIGDFNGWRLDAHPASARPDGSGVWECEVPGASAVNCRPVAPLMALPFRNH